MNMSFRGKENEKCHKNKYAKKQYIIKICIILALIISKKYFISKICVFTQK